MNLGSINFINYTKSSLTVMATDVNYQETPPIVVLLESKSLKFPKKFNPKKIVSKWFTNKQEYVKQLKAIIKSLEIIEKLEKKDPELEEEDSTDETISSKRNYKDDVIENLLTKLFSSLKRSELINPILEYSLTDDYIRLVIIDITIELLEADVIPWTEIFTALKSSGLATDIIKFLLTDPETKEGQLELILNLLSRLLEEGIIHWKDIIEKFSPPPPPFEESFGESIEEPCNEPFKGTEKAKLYSPDVMLSVSSLPGYTNTITERTSTINALL